MNQSGTVQTILVLIPVCLLSGCGQMSGYALNQAGRRQYDNGNYAAAAYQFQQAVISDPGNADYLANLANSRRKMGDQAAAEKLYRHAVTVNLAHQPSYHALAELMMESGRTDQAVGMMQTWAASQPYVAESHVELAWALRESGQPQAASQALQQALTINPSHPKALARLGELYEESGQPQLALNAYQQSLQSDWSQPEVQSRFSAVAGRVGPAHPAGATAMARGVAPSTAFAPPAGPTQVQTAYGNPPQAAFVPGMQHTAYAAPSFPYPGGVQASGAFAPGNIPDPQLMPRETAAAASPGMTMPSGLNGMWYPTAQPQYSPAPAFAAPTPAAQTAHSPNPVPDPAFSAAAGVPQQSPFSQISYSTPPSASAGLSGMTLPAPAAVSTQTDVSSEPDTVPEVTAF